MPADSARDRPSLRWTISARSARVSVPAGVRFLVQPRDPEIGHNHSPAHKRRAPRRCNYTFVTETVRVGNSTFRRICQLYQYRSAAAPQVKPPPIASSTIRSPRLIRPSLTAVSSASGTDAAEVLACWSTVTMTFSGGRPSFLRGGVEDARVRLVRHDPVDVVRGQSGRLQHLVQHGGEVDDRVAEHLAALHPAACRPCRWSTARHRQTEGRCGGRRHGAGWRGCRLRSPLRPSTSAPAPSPNRTQVARSSQSRMRLKVSAPITSALLRAAARSIKSATDSA